MNGTSGAEDREIRLTRVFNTPKEDVFRAWTDPDRVVQWWGPDGFSTATESMDMRPGGVWRFVMHGPGGDYSNVIVYRDINPPDRLAYIHGGGSDDPHAFEVTVDFESAGAGTRVTMVMRFPTRECRDRVVEDHGAVEGGNQTLARLAACLEIWAAQQSKTRQFTKKEKP